METKYQIHMWIFFINSNEQLLIKLHNFVRYSHYFV